MSAVGLKKIGVRDSNRYSGEHHGQFIQEDRTEDSRRMFPNNVVFHNLYKTTTESCDGDYLDEKETSTGDHLESVEKEDANN